MKLIFYDFEVLKNDWLVSFYKEDTKQWFTFRNNREALGGFILQHKNSYYFVGFNSKPFDDQCLKAIWYGINPYRIVEHSIIEGKTFWTLPEFQYKRNIPNFVSIDLKKFPKMKSLSLKEIEGNLGLAIVENDLLDKDKLTDEEYKEVLEYNKHDVLATYKLYQQIKDEVECKKELIDDFKLDKKCFNETYVAIARKILDAKIIKQDESFIYHKPSCINLDHKDIENIFNNVEFNLDSKIKEEKEINGLKIVFGIGGGHGSIDNFKYKYDNDHVIVILDVESMYPNFMENKNNKEFNFLSRSVDNPNLFAIIKEKRIKYKHNGNKKKSNAYKVVINGQYGASIFFYNNKQPAPLTDWVNGRKVCITGQLSLIMLLEACNKIDGFRAFNLNTDGIYGILPKSALNRLKIVLKQWESALGFNLETKILNKSIIIQKDVNNYIIYDEETNFIKCTGGDVNIWNGGDYANNSSSIIDESIVKYFIYNKPINETLQEAYDKNEVIKFQIILNRKGINYTDTYYGDKIVQKVNRIFPSLDQNLPPLTRMKNGTKCLFPLCPPHCSIHNESVENINLKNINLDLTYYFNIIKSKIEQWRS